GLSGGYPSRINSRSASADRYSVTSDSTSQLYRSPRICAIVASDRRPSQSSRIAAPVGLSRTAPSGYSSTCCWRTASKSSRAKRHNVGIDVGVSGSSGFGIRVMDRVDHQPEQFQLEGKGFERPALRFDGGAPRQHEVQPLLAVAGCLHEAAPEVL